MAVVGHTTVTKSKAVAADLGWASGGSFVQRLGQFIATGPTEAINLLIKKCASPEIMEAFFMLFVLDWRQCKSPAYMP